MRRKVALVMVHTSPLEQAGIGDAGGMNIYVIESAKRMAADRKSTRLNSSHIPLSRMPSSA